MTIEDKCYISVVLGSQWGDEGKGKLVDILSQKSDLCARFAGGNNAGHTIVAHGQQYNFHLLPSGFVNEQCINLIGNGVVVHLPSLFQEIKDLEEKGLKTTGKLVISDRAHLVFDYHQIVDGLKEKELGLANIGTTKKGIGPAYSNKASRSGLRVHHLSDFPSFESKFRENVTSRRKRYGHFDYDVEKEIALYRKYAIRLKPFITDTVYYMHEAIARKKSILIEGANALMLDIDFGTYPYVTSSSCNIGGVLSGLGIPPQKINRIIGVVKAYTTRVGEGPFPTELNDDIGQYLQTIGQEYGVTTGRQRRCGWIDMMVLQYSTMINGYTCLNLTKLDVLDGLDEIKLGTSYTLDGKQLKSFPADMRDLAKVQVQYETMPGWSRSIKKCKVFMDLPEACRNYVNRIEEILGVPIQWIGNGADRLSMIER